MSKQLGFTTKQNQHNTGKEHSYLALLLPVIDDVSTVCWRSFSDSECLTLYTVTVMQTPVVVSDYSAEYEYE